MIKNIAIFDEEENGNTTIYLISNKNNAHEAIEEIYKQNKKTTDYVFLNKIKPKDIQKNIFK